jgi:hypothetical protein
MSKVHATVPKDPNDCGYKLTEPTRKMARARVKATLGHNHIPYRCTVCKKWHFRAKGTKPKNMQ